MWTEGQRRRLKELRASHDQLEELFESDWERNRTFQLVEDQLVRRERELLESYRTARHGPMLCELERRLASALVGSGFVQVTTPIMMSRRLLAKMTIDDTHPLASQVYWVDRNKCLRPMLAPHLYYVLKDLIRLWPKPVRIFEVGPCFRKESKGAQHTSEFTMLNVVEMGLPEEERHERIGELATLVTRAAGLQEYRLETEASEVYGETLDVVAGKEALEVGSGAMGPHPLDRAWGITDTWVGIGFGLERLLMALEDSPSLGRMGRSLAYLNGVRLAL